MIQWLFNLDSESERSHFVYYLILVKLKEVGVVKTLNGVAQDRDVVLDIWKEETESLLVAL